MSMDRMLAGKSETEKRMGLRPHAVITTTAVSDGDWFDHNGLNGIKWARVDIV